MASEVFFTDLRTGPGNNLLVKLENLVSTAGIGKIGFRDKFVAIKIHFGEYGNMAYLRPNYAAVIVRMIQNLGGKPFLTDANTLYSSGCNTVYELFLQCQEYDDQEVITMLKQGREMADKGCKVPRLYTVRGIAEYCHVGISTVQRVKNTFNL